jgi:hypothetical protein
VRARERGEVEAIRIERGARVVVRAGGREADLAAVASLAEPPPGAPPALGPVELFKIEQVLALEARGGATELTVTRPPDLFEATILDATAGDGARVRFRTTAGEEREAPAAALSIQAAAGRAPAIGLT